jgi:hypothetical protein
MAVVELEMVLQLTCALEQRLELRIVGCDVAQTLMQRAELVLHREHDAVRLHRAIEHRAVEPLGGLLRQVAEPRAAREHARTGLGGQLAQDDAEQRRLARAVRADERDTVTRAEHPVEAVEQDA